MSKGAAAVAAQVVRLIVPAGQASPSPPVGPALGARGVKSMDFVKEFNARTAHLLPGTPTPVRITIQPDRTFTFELRTPPTSHLIKTCAGITLGAAEAGRKPLPNTISLKHVYEIAMVKSKDTKAGLEATAKSVVASCKSMGVPVVP